MAVDIPVRVDIESAFDDAAKRVHMAIKPLQKAIDNNTAKVQLKVGEEWDDTAQKMVSKYESLKDIINKINTDARTGAKSMAYSTQEWATALDDAKTKLSDLLALQARGESVNPVRVTSLRESVVVLTEAIAQRTHEVELIEKTTKRAIESKNAEEERGFILSQEANTIAQINERLGALRGKLDNLNPKTKEWTATAREIRKTTVELEKYQSKVELLGTKSGSIDRMSLKMRQLEQQWNAMSKAQKFDANGNLKASAQKIIEKYRELTQEVQQSGKTLEEYVNKGTVAFQKQGKVLNNLTSIASMYFSVFGLIRFVKQLRDVTGELEYQRVALGHLIQDEEYGAQLFNKIKNLAVESPFRIEQLVTYTKQLAAYRIEQENLYDTTKRLADISAGLGVDMNRLILAYGQVRAASVLRGQELRQFTEAGIPLVDLLADKMGELHDTTYRTADVFKLISERAVPFSAIGEIFEELTEKGGMFYKMQEEQAKTLKGRWEKLKDAYSLGLQEAGETQSFIVQNNLVLGALTLLAKNIRIVPKIIEAIGVAWVAYTIATMKATRATRAARFAQIELSADELKEIATKNLSVKATGRLTRAMLRQKAATNAVSRAFWKLTAAMISNPIGALIAGVSALVALFVTWKKKTDDQTQSFKELTEAIENVSASEKSYERLNKQINAYERLASKTERTAKENVQLARTLDVLRTAFPSVTLSIDQSTDALSKNIEELKKLNEQNRLKGLQSARRQYTLAYSDSKKMQAEIASLMAEQEKAWSNYDYWVQQTGAESKEAKKAREEYDKLGETLEEKNKNYLQTLRYLQELDKYLNPDKADQNLYVWQKTMKQMMNFKVGKESFNLIGEKEIEQFSSLYDALKKIDKLYIDSTNSANEMKASMANVSDEFKEDAENELRIQEARRDAAKAILDVFGYTSSIDKKKGPSSRIAILKEELKNVQEIYKRYKDFLKYMSQGDAEKKIKEIYSGVTAIDFLSPETYKRRLEDLLSELRKMQGRIKSGSKQLTADMAEDLKDMLRGDEGFRSKAYKLPGEKYYTIGYGFYKQLTDGREVVEDMTMTMDEAEEELNRQVKRTADYTAKIIAEYGKGLEITDRQFNVLANLAYQGPSVLKRVLQEANGDINKLAEALKNAAWPYVSSSLQDSVKTRDMRRALLFQLAGAQTEDDAKEIASTIFNVERIVQDVDWDEFKDVIKERLDRLSSEIKKSEEARDFFKNIFEATGSEDIARNLTMSVYGNLGSDLEHKLSEQLSSAFILDDKKIKNAGLSYAQAAADVAEAILKNDYLLLYDYLDYVTDANKENAKKILNERIKDNAAWYKDFVKTYTKSKKFQERIDTIERQRKAAKEEAQQRGVDEEGKNAIDSYYDKKIAEVEVERLKSTDEWIKSFEKLDKAGTTTLKDLIRLIEELIEKSGADMTPESLKTLTQNLEQAKEEIYRRNPFTSLASAAKDYIGALGELKKAKKDYDNAEENSDDSVNAFEKLKKAENTASESIEKMQSAVDGLGDVFNNLKSIVSSATDVLNLDELSDSRAILDGIAQGLGLVGTALVFINAMFALLKTNPVVLAISGVIGAVASLASVIGNVKVNRAEKEIKKQERLLDDLSNAYDRLSNSAERVFGADYLANYNARLNNLRAQEIAYQKQADAERKKGKKKDEDKIREYEKSEKEVAERIAEMQSEVSERFLGSDLASAARDFADAWISAYKEFSSTTEAMQERFADMIQNMIVESLAAKIIERQLEPVFSLVDSLSKDDNQLSIMDAYAVAERTKEAIAGINTDMSNFMNALSDVGLNVRTMGTGLTGIAKDLQGASEESILGLAAGVNTQNFYMAQINENVLAIVQHLRGETPVSVTPAPIVDYANSEEFITRMYNLDVNLATLLQKVDSVITPKNTSSNTHCIAIK